MFYASLLAIFLLIISYFQLRSFFHQKKRKDSLVYFTLMILAGYLSIGSILNLNIPNPRIGIEYLFKPIQSWILHLLN